MFFEVLYPLITPVFATYNYNGVAGFMSIELLLKMVAIHGVSESTALKADDTMRDKKEINIHIGNEIRNARERAGLTQEQFGELVSLGTKNVSDIERGVAGITVSTLKRICEKLSISSDLIIFGDRENNDVEYIADKLARLPPEQFEAVKAILNQIFQLLAVIECNRQVIGRIDKKCRESDNVRMTYVNDDSDG